MTSIIRSWWQKAKKPLEVAIVSILITGFIALIIVIIFGYIFNWSWTGLGPYSPPSKNSGFQPGKTLWDWLQLLIIPLVLAIGGYLFNFANSRTERDIAADNQREVALKEYFDQLSELLLKEHLGELKPEYESVRKIARVRTLTVLRRLDANRKRNVLQFLYESSLIDKDNPVIDLKQADLRKADLSFASLRGANLKQVDLSGANLGGAFLSQSDLLVANLNGADLLVADLRGAHLIYADLRGADLRGSELDNASLDNASLEGATGITIKALEKKAKLLKGAIMPDGSECRNYHNLATSGA